MSRRGLCRRGLLVAVGLAAVPVSAVLSGCSDDDSESVGAGDDEARSGEPGGPVLYSTPTCGCCGEYATYLQSNGYDVTVERLEDLSDIKARAGVPESAEACHTTFLGDYAVEGHVPVEAIEKLLAEKPAIDAIALPGMPGGSPGMSGTKAAPFEILSIKDGAIDTYMTV